MKKTVELEHTSNDISWRVCLEAEDDDVAIKVVGTDASTGVIQAEVKLRSTISTLGYLGDLLVETTAHLGVGAWPRSVVKKAYTVEEARKSHSKAYMPWTPEDDESLVTRYQAGSSVAELAKEFNRGEGAVQSRLLKFGQSV